MENLKIRDVRAIMTAPAGIDLIVVKVETNEPELYGLGCATFTQRGLAVQTAVDQYLKPFWSARTRAISKISGSPAWSTLLAQRSGSEQRDLRC